MFAEPFFVLFKRFDAYVQKVRFFNKNFFRLLQVLYNLYRCFKVAAKTNTIFHYGKNCARRFVNHKYFSKFLGTVPTFGFRISIVENVRSQNFMKNWLSEVQKFYRIRLLFKCTTYTDTNICTAILNRIENLIDLKSK